MQIAGSSVRGSGLDEGRLAVAEEIYEDDIRRVEATIGYDKQKLAAVITKIRKSTMPLLTT